MLLNEAQDKINSIANKPFYSLFTMVELENIIINKGKTGQLLELALGMKLTSGNLDFEDGELKTNKCDKNGKPLETVFITQIASIIDELLEQKSFKETHLYKKINNILYVPVCKVGRPQNWFFLPSTHINLKLSRFAPLLEIWREDYYNICGQLKSHIENSADGFIHTSNGQHLQIRSKDSKPYHPIYSQVYRKEISNKNHAFYFMKSFMQYINDAYA